MGEKVSVDQLADTIMEMMAEYAQTSTDMVKESVLETGKSVKKDIQMNAPVKTGRYKKSWSTKKVKENVHSLFLVVHSRNRYQLAHLLEKGHAKRGGDRVKAIPHIAPAEQKGAEELVKRIKGGFEK